MSTISVRNAAGDLVTLTINDDPATGGRQDQLIAEIGSVSSTPAADDNPATAGLNALIRRLLARVTLLIGALPAVRGQTTKANSLSITTASDDDLNVRVGSLTDGVASLPSSSASLGGLIRGFWADLKARNPIDVNSNRKAVLYDTSGNALAISPGSAATKTTVAGATSSAVILASNVNRVMAAICNDSAAIMYLSLGSAAASTTSYSVKVQADQTVIITDYIGPINAVWASATGNARVTEVV